jgi:hypothetical protein
MSLLVLCLLSTAGGPFDSFDPVNGIHIHGDSASLTTENNATRYVLKGHALASNKTTTFTASSIECLVGPEPALKGKLTLLKATSKGSVKIVRAIAGRTTTLTGSRALYTEAKGLGELLLAGPVSMIDSKPNGAAIKATGDRGDAELDVRVGKLQTGFRNANLYGVVTVDVIQPANKGEHYRVTGDHMNLNNVSKPAKLSLTGDLVIKSLTTGSVATGSKQITLNLSETGEIQRVSAGGGK